MIGTMVASSRAQEEPMRTIFTSIVAMTTGALLVPGCSQRATGIDARRSVLTAFESCDQLETYLEDRALDQVGRSYYWGWGGVRALGAPQGQEGALGGMQGAPSDAQAGGGLTGTNNQEMGVDEADFVKSDDQFIYVLHGQKLVIMNAFPAAEARVVSQTDLEGWPWQMFVSGNLALILADAPVERGGDPVELGGVPVGGYWFPRLIATVLDLGDRTAPTVVRRSLVDGSLVGARLVGRSARVVTAHYTPIELDWNVTVDRAQPQPPDCGWVGGSGSTGVDVPPSGTGTRVGERRAGLSDCDAQWAQYDQEMAAYQQAYIDAVRAANVDRVRAMTLDELLPQVETTVGANTTDGPISDCTSFYRTEVDSGYGLVSVSTFDLDHPTDQLDATTVVGDYGQIYASTDQLYLAMAAYPGWGARWPEAGSVLMTTAIHQFDIGSDPRGAPYVASGEVEGYAYSSFAFDERGGYLRVATTVDRAAQDWSVSRDNLFSVLAPSDGLLTTVGSIPGIAPGDQIYAARLFDEQGYLVTYRTVDPLFALDLRDPTNPVITGELDIPGFSQYMHPLGSGHLLTVGTDVDWGLKLSIFDVSDPAAPALAHEQPLGQGYSEAQYDHHAFTFKPTTDAGDEGILALPLSTWNDTGGGGADLVVFDVSASDGFVDLGTVSHTDLFTDPADAYCGLRDVRRSVMSDDDVYSISYGGFKVNPLSDLMQTLASGTFPQTDLCGYVQVDGGVTGGGVPATK
jgi:uncharacterized secreted protein with C-terminal beta-propeller domain